jgi:hypothetical protein
VHTWQDHSHIQLSRAMGALRPAGRRRSKDRGVKPEPRLYIRAKIDRDKGYRKILRKPVT